MARSKLLFLKVKITSICLLNVPFFLEVWRIIKDFIGISTNWGEGSLENSFHIWLINKYKFKLLPIFISWSIWNARNHVVFQDIQPNALYAVLEAWIFTRNMRNLLAKGNKRRFICPQKFLKEWLDFLMVLPIMIFVVVVLCVY